MTKEELLREVESRCGEKSAVVHRVVQALIETMSDAVSQGERVPLVPFGIFEPVERAARLCRNPKTGEFMEVPAYQSVRFKLSKKLKTRVN
ncbi:HU family DNA-binding protein [Alicyclobacillus sp. TC]|uniref:Nucleoid DNA-binding protein n=2 Tax=Alicyclobacillus tolerans TaxID=90970 RepID=A0ABT9LVH9_9BACL|nr:MULTISPECIES: HU family DNA-binding protein [Alicyclobacillus]MDP9728281.1 nucleoid DNA-binding protein [Alicyclobacillus tengchongensis]QRF23486.1 HU family DNA-binding protein [Alicyclobacillus sp. TC]SHK94147.1 DNA-binding protein HU-beta [Alicyclobacillus montanus]